MKSIIKKLFYNPLISGSLVIILGSNFANFLNYLYHLFAGRLLGPEKYGELVSVLSFLGLLSVIPLSIGLFIVREVSKSNEHKYSSVVLNLNNLSIKVSVFLAVLVIIFSPTLSRFMNIDSKLIVIMGALIFIFWIRTSFNKFILQGLLRFKESVYITIGESMIKLSSGILLLTIGLGINGAFLGICLSALVGWILSKYYLREFLSNSMSSVVKDVINIKEAINFSIPVLIQSIAITSLFSVDIILTKHFLSSYDSGVYAATSNLGKIIFYICGPLITVMFPLVIQWQKSGRNYKKIFTQAMGLICSGVIFLLLIYHLFPKFIVQSLYGEVYLDSVKYLFEMGLFMAFLTISSMMINFSLSLNKTKVVIIPLIAAIVQVVGILLFHSNIDSIVRVSVFTTLGMAIILIVQTVFLLRDQHEVI